MSKCETIVRSRASIVIAALLGGEKAVDWYVRKGVPVPNEETWKVMITKVQILVSMLKNSTSYLGDFNHVRVQHDMGVVYLFPIGTRKVLCVVTKPEKESALIGSIKKHLAKMK